MRVWNGRGTPEEPPFIAIEIRPGSGQVSIMQRYWLRKERSGDWETGDAVLTLVRAVEAVGSQSGKTSAEVVVADSGEM